LSRIFAASANRRFKFDERNQLFSGLAFFTHTANGTPQYSALRIAKM
jgi:hypothetical protein